MTEIPGGYRPVEGSERHPAPGARRVGPAHPDETVSVSIYVRPRPGAPPLPDIEYWMKPQPGGGQFLSQEEFARRHGATQADLAKVETFARAHGLRTDEVHSGRRVVVVSGTVAQMNKAFAVDLGRYESPEETYRGREGHIHLPSDLADIVEGVFGLDNRRVGHPHVVTVTPPQVTKQYDFPVGLATGQTIGILEFGGGFLIADITAYLTGLGLTVPTVNVVSVDGATNTQAGNKAIPNIADVEVTLDIVVAAGAAPGANIAVYFAPNTGQGWVDAFTTALGDTTNNPSVISLSWSGDEVANFTPSARSAISNALRSAAALGITVFVDSGDNGSSKPRASNFNAYVQYPPSDPWVTACGGTVIQNLSPYSEVTWNDASGATGGGISTVFGLPPYQLGAGVPPSVTDGVTTGRGVPDIAGDAGGSGGGYDFILYGSQTSLLRFLPPLGAPPGTVGNRVGPVGGTSAVAPLYAGLIARINALSPTRAGIITPALYLIGKTPWLNVFRDIADGISNSFSFTTPTGVAGASPGYSAGPGWDACTGWGVADGAKLQAALRLGHKINNADSSPYAPGACQGISGSGTAVQLFWRANDHSHLIFTSGSGGGFSFPPGSPINGIDKTPKSPAACLFNEKLFLFWMANDPSHRIVVSSSANGVTWPAGTAINTADRTPDSPAACVFLQHIFLFWKADDSSNSILVSSSVNGHSFPPGKPINPVDHTSEAPAVCLFNNQIFLFWRADDDSGSIYFTSSPDGLKFPKGRKINSVDSTPVSPSACVVDKQLFLFWKSNDDLDYLYWSVSRDGVNWPDGRKVNYPDATPDTPVPVTFNKNLFLYWRADDSSNAIYAASWPFSLFK